MVFAKIIFLFSGWNHGIFRSAIVSGFGGGDSVLCSLLMALVIAVRTLIFGDPVAGWTSLICIIFLVGGIQLFCTGILGQYLAKTYLETKHRPIYILKESSGEKEAEEKKICEGQRYEKVMER